MIIARRLKITGRVQGVGYRDWFLLQARKLKLTGWVRNRNDGWVEALCIGSEADVWAIIACAHDGPHLAHVDHIEIETAQGIAALDFRRLPTV